MCEGERQRTQNEKEIANNRSYSYRSSSAFASRNKKSYRNPVPRLGILESSENLVHPDCSVIRRDTTHGCRASGRDILGQVLEPFQSGFHRFLGQRNEPSARLVSTQLDDLSSTEEHEIHSFAVFYKLSRSRDDVIIVPDGGGILGDQDALRVPMCYRGLDLDQVNQISIPLALGWRKT